MSLTVFKYRVEATEDFSVRMPVGAEILSVQTQYGEPQIWALVNPNADTELRHFFVTGTGHTIDRAIEQLLFIGTFQLNGGALVFHLFEVVSP